MLFNPASLHNTLRDESNFYFFRTASVFSDNFFVQQVYFAAHYQDGAIRSRQFYEHLYQKYKPSLSDSALLKAALSCFCWTLPCSPLSKPSLKQQAYIPLTAKRKEV